MKANKNFVLRQVAGTWVLLPLGDESAKLLGMITLNDTGVFLWDLLEKGATREQLCASLTQEYDVTEDEAYADIDLFVEKLKNTNCIIEN